MSKSSPVCCDASIVVRLITGADGGAAGDLWARWRTEGRQVIAPVLLRYEVANAFHRLLYAGRASEAGATEYLQTALALPIDYRDDTALHRRAVEIARRFNRPAAYDAHYLAVAQEAGAEFWTTDERLFNAVRHEFFWINLVKSRQTPASS